MYKGKANQLAKQSQVATECQIKEPSRLGLKDFRERSIDSWFTFFFGGVEMVDFDEYNQLHERFFHSLLEASGRQDEFDSLGDDECFGPEELADQLDHRQQLQAWERFLGIESKLASGPIPSDVKQQASKAIAKLSSESPDCDELWELERFFRAYYADSDVNKLFNQGE